MYYILKRLFPIGLGLCTALVLYLHPLSFQNPTETAFFTLLVAAGITAGLRPMELVFTKNLVINVFDILLYVTIFLFPFSWAAWGAFTIALCHNLIFLGRGYIHWSRWWVGLFNVSNYVLKFSAGAAVYTFFHSSSQPGGVENLIAFVLCGATVSTVALSTGILISSLDFGIRIRDAARLFPCAFGYAEDLILVSFGAITTFLLRSPGAILLLAVPVLVLLKSNWAHAQVFKEISAVMEAVLKILEARDSITFGHSERVAIYAKQIATKMGIDEQESREIYRAALIHDIGNVVIPDDILFKDGRISGEERLLVRSHVGALKTFLENLPPFRVAVELAYCHHEKYDGTGYPFALKENQIPLGSRIISVADAYDSMTSDRPYRKGMDRKVALRRLAQASGTQFDPEVAAALISYLEEELPADELLSAGPEEEDQQAPDSPAGHILVLSLEIASRMDLPPGTCDNLREAALAHHFTPPASIWIAPSQFCDPWVRMEMKDHIDVNPVGLLAIAEDAACVIRSHHEWYNGEGYPLHQEGEGIPLDARIFAVADAFVWLVNGLEAGNPCSPSMALEAIRDRSGAQFDPGIVEVLAEILEAKEGNHPRESRLEKARSVVRVPISCLLVA
ncbi:MAG: HD domain-containing protein [Armatimonadetes bacterium]|nr:HD domain-containing protein [Armatimonadota bacterium]